MWIEPREDVCLGSVSLLGPADRAIAQPSVVLRPDRPLGVYGMSESAYMNVSVSESADKLRYRIMDPVRNETIAQGRLPGKGKRDMLVTLPTGRRGFFRVEVLTDDGAVAQAQRAYVVINRDRGTAASRQFYGLAAEEEHGSLSMVNARLTPRAIYQFVADIGIGNLRMFSSARPDRLSRDGINYDFHELDAALELARENDMDVLMELGSNTPHRVPAWLRSRKGGGDVIDLASGLKTKRLKNALARTKEKGRFLSLARYRAYLEAVFLHTGDRVASYEIWNEPGHKFLPGDYVTLARITRDVQQKYAPHARLLGPTSTSVHEHGRGRDPGALPGFLSTVMKDGLGKYIDIVSYHSRHAFNFLGKDFDRRNQETGYATRIRKVMKKEGMGGVPMWDTERGVPWSSYHRERTDIWAGKRYRDSWVMPYDYLEPAKRLPHIFAASRAEGVQRLFWFNLDPSVSTLARSRVRWGMFDADMEPMPQITAYDAFAEIIGDGVFRKRVEKPDGTRCYVFSRGSKTIVLVFNWKERSGSVRINYPGAMFTIRDAMGNVIAEGHDSYHVVSGAWSKYVVIPKTADGLVIE